ncbi:DUF6233 domain-containing protein [Streptomyces sp. NPDC048192]|uniref:DUF6233 domain-containing protein n=1 Tax=Streptomyces sp. NPDC048192 TaxID=3365510 RepID=UPI00371DEBA7
MRRSCRIPLATAQTETLKTTPVQCSYAVALALFTSRQQALDALRRQVPACVHCRPDTALGLLE